MGIEFDNLFGWEVTLLKPTDFWTRVPQKYRDKYSYVNIPISADVNHPSHPLAVMRNLKITPDDFVAFKLDIDTSSVELPIAILLLQNDEFTSLVDEFFFEFHFR